MDKISVLLAEDEETLAMIIRDTLEPQGFIIATAKNNSANRATYTLKITDIAAEKVVITRNGQEAEGASDRRTTRRPCCS